MYVSDNRELQTARWPFATLANSSSNTVVNRAAGMAYTRDCGHHTTGPVPADLKQPHRLPECQVTSLYALKPV